MVIFFDQVNETRRRKSFDWLHMTKQIPLSRGLFALIDDSHFELVSQHKWYAQSSHGKTYAARNVTVSGKRAKVYLHRLIAGVTDRTLHIDHVDGNGLNNTTNNLRVATVSQNLCNRGKQANNTTGHKGVYRTKSGFMARVGSQGGSIYAGHFKSADQAAEAYFAVSATTHGQFGKI